MRDGHPDHRRARLASMRPRRVRLGCRGSSDGDSRRAQASMRPRRVRLGCCPDRRRMSPSVRRRFNEAEARTPRMRRIPVRVRRRRRASMRPRRVRLGCVAHMECMVHACAASMRPRRVRLGCPLHVSAQHPRGVASMRPRRVRLGCIFSDNDTFRYSIMLQ